MVNENREMIDKQIGLRGEVNDFLGNQDGSRHGRSGNLSQRPFFGLNIVSLFLWWSFL